MTLTADPTVGELSSLTLSTPEPGIALLTLYRPERLNALSPDLLAELHDTLDAARPPTRRAG